MSSGGGYEKSVKGGTKSKLAAPKSKYVSHLLQATRSGDAAIGEVFRGLQYRLKEPTWTIVFKSLILTHMLIRDGQKDSVLDYLANSRQFRVTSLTSTGCSPMSEQGPNIQAYGAYLTARIKAFASVKTDYVKTKSDTAGQGRLRKLSVEKGLLRETESVQKLIGPLIKCKFLETDVDNDIILTAFRLLVADLLVLFQVANEGVINVLEHYFEMSKPDADRALVIYQNFVDQTDGVIVYMSLARSLESVTRLEIPNLQHAPTSLGTSLEEYLRDPDFEQNRIQYLTQKQNGKSSSGPARQENSATTADRGNAPLKSALKSSNDSNPFGAAQLPPQIAASGNADLLDFFDSIEQPQSVPQQYGQSSQPYVGQQYQLQPQATTNPYALQQMQAQQHMTAQGVQASNPYQQMPQQSAAQFSNFHDAQNNFSTNNSQAQAQYPPASASSYNSFTQTPMQSQATGAGFGSYTPQPINGMALQPQPMSLQPQATGSNPFRKSMMPVSVESNNFGVMAPQRTGGNPFSRGPAPSTGTPLFANGLQPQQTSQYSSYQQQQQQQQQALYQQQSHGRVASDSMMYGAGSQQAPMQVNMTGNMMPQQTGTSNPFRKSMMPAPYGQQQQQQPFSAF